MLRLEKVGAPYDVKVTLSYLLDQNSLITGEAMRKGSFVNPVFNVGIKAPRWSPPWRVYNGGHGSVDTLPIVAAIHVPGGKTGVLEEPVRIADLGVTAAALFGLALRSSTVGKNLSEDII